jgi:hypothetical protein
VGSNMKAIEALARKLATKDGHDPDARTQIASVQNDDSGVVVYDAMWRMYWRDAETALARMTGGMTGEELDAAFNDFDYVVLGSRGSVTKRVHR